MDKLEKARLDKLAIDHDFKVCSDFTMGVKECDLAPGDEFNIRVIMGADGLKPQAIMDKTTGGSGPRVQLANTFRKKCSAFQLKRMHDEGLVIHLNDIAEIPKTKREKHLEAVAYLKVLKSTDPRGYEQIIADASKQ